MTQKAERMAQQPAPARHELSPCAGRLHEFQARLLDRMNAARDNADTRGNRLGVMVGNRCCLLDLREAEEIINLLPIVKVPLTRDWYLGLANVRGNLIGIVDLARFLREENHPIARQGRIIVASGALSAACGFLVTRVLGLRNVHAMTVQQHDNGDSASAGYLDCNRNLWTELSLTRIVRDPRFLRVGLPIASSAERE